MLKAARESAAGVTGDKMSEAMRQREQHLAARRREPVAALDGRGPAMSVGWPGAALSLRFSPQRGMIWEDARRLLHVPAACDQAWLLREVNEHFPIAGPGGHAADIAVFSKAKGVKLRRMDNLAEFSSKLKYGDKDVPRRRHAVAQIVAAGEQLRRRDSLLPPRRTSASSSSSTDWRPCRWTSSLTTSCMSQRAASRQ